MSTSIHKRRLHTSWTLFTTRSIRHGLCLFTRWVAYSITAVWWSHNGWVRCKTLSTTHTLMMQVISAQWSVLMWHCTPTVRHLILWCSLVQQRTDSVSIIPSWLTFSVPSTFSKRCWPVQSSEYKSSTKPGYMLTIHSYRTRKKITSGSIKVTT